MSRPSPRPRPCRRGHRDRPRRGLGNCFAASFTSAGSRTAAVPMMTRLTPFSSQPSMVFMSRMPPPSCTQSPTASRMRSTAATFIGLPANAPSRSTTCRCSKPCGLEGMGLRRRIAVEDGGARHVALLQAHAQAVLQIDGGKQDHVTLTRSAIGRQIRMASGPSAPLHGFQFRKLAIKASPSFWLFSGWNCVPAMLSRDNHGGDRPAIVGLGQQVARIGGLELIGVHEIGMQPVGTERDAVEQLVRLAGG